MIPSESHREHVMDFEGIGTAMAVGSARRALTTANCEIDKANDLIERKNARIAFLEADAEATEAGRVAQIGLLRAALAEANPGHELLRETGRVWTTGKAECGWHVPFAPAYDEVARLRGIPTVNRATTPERARVLRAERTRDAVLVEPIEIAAGWFLTRITWRGAEYRTRALAEKARAAAAEVARAASV